MNDGKIEQAADPRTVFEQPATAFVARFMGDHNVISGRIVDTNDDGVKLEVIGGGQFLATGRTGAIGGPVDIAIRTDHVKIGETVTPGLGFTGIVSNIEYRGSTVKLSVTGAGIEDFTVILDDTDFFGQSIVVGAAIPLSWESRDAIVLGRLDS
jgi:putative spermidine/putrescine transport system ATP-binding protein